MNTLAILILVQSSHGVRLNLCTTIIRMSQHFPCCAKIRFEKTPNRSFYLKISFVGKRARADEAQQQSLKLLSTGTQGQLLNK